LTREQASRLAELVQYEYENDLTKDDQIELQELRELAGQSE